MELQNVEITKPLVAKGLGISIVPYPSVATSAGRAGLAYRRFGERRIYRELGWVYLRSDYRSRAVGKLLDLFAEVRVQITER
jgi:DNA-binding transcriptional LysR family regulator